LFAAALLVLPLAGCLFGTEEAERRVEQARGVGEMTRLTFSAPPIGPFEWVSDHEVVFLMLSGRVTVDIATGELTEVEDPTVTPSTQSPAPAAERTLPPGNRYGPRQVTSDGRFLTTDDSGDVSCGALLVSPDGRYVACSYTVTDRMAESSQGGPAVIRLR